jgi:hypothetical protein
MTQMQTQEADGSALRSFIITRGAGIGQVEDRQRFVTRTESNRYRTADRKKFINQVRITQVKNGRQSQGGQNRKS